MPNELRDWSLLEAKSVNFAESVMRTGRPSNDNDN